MKRVTNVILDYTEISNVTISDLRLDDAPDFADAFVTSATYKGRDMSEIELGILNEDSGYVYEQLQAWLY